MLSTNGLGTLIVNGSVSTTYAGNLNNGTGSIASGTLTIGLGDGSLALVKSGSSTLTVSGSNTYTGGTTISGGALAMVKSQAWNPVLSGPGTADIQTGRAIFDYTGASSPAATIQSILTASYGTGFASGQIHSSTATSQLGLGWTDDGSKTTVAYTYFGDANLDLNVDTVDFNLLAANFSGTGKNWGQGDFNYDGAVDTVDFNLLAANFSKTAPGAQSVGGGNLGALVPEPTGLALAGAIGSALIARRRRRQ